MVVSQTTMTIAAACCSLINWCRNRDQNRELRRLTDEVAGLRCSIHELAAVLGDAKVRRQ